MDKAGETVIDLALIAIALLLVLTVLGTLFPSLMDSIKQAISGGVGSATDTAIQTAGAAVKGAGDAIFSTGGSSPSDTYSTLSLQGNPSSPAYGYLFGPEKFTFGSFWRAINAWWQETINPALGNGASGPSAGGFPAGTDVSNYHPGNWADVIYAPLPPNLNFGVDSHTQNLLDYLGAQG